MERYRFKSIEFLRFFFSWLIVYHHMSVIKPFLPDIPMHQRFSCLAVDFFFILSGFFLFYTMNNEQTVLEFLGKKFKRLWAVVAFYVVSFICLNSFNADPYFKNMHDTVYPLLFLNNVGITLQRSGPLWYVSVLVFVSLFYFYLYKALSKRTANLITGLLVWAAYVCIVNAQKGTISGYMEIYNGIFCMGILRGIGGMGLGIFLCYLYGDKNLLLSNRDKPSWKITLLEIAILAWLTYAMYMAPLYIKNAILFIIAFVVLICFFLTERGYFSRLFNFHFSEVLGKYSYSIFLCHMPLLFLFRCVLQSHGELTHFEQILSLSLVYLIVLSVGIIVYHLIENPQNRLFKKVGYVNYYLLVFGVMLLSSFGVAEYLSHKPLRFNRTYDFSQNCMQITTSGLSHMEEWGKWSDGKEVKLKFYVKNCRKNLRFDFKIKPYLNAERPQQSVTVFANNKKITTWQFDYGQPQPKTSFVLPSGKIKGKHIKISFVIKNPVSPKELGLGSDKRRLGIGLKSMKVTEF